MSWSIGVLEWWNIERSHQYSHTPSLHHSALVGCAIALLLTVAGCRGGQQSHAALAPTPVQFHDVSQSAGIRFVHRNGAFGKKFMPETVGSGCAFFDYDNDGHIDLFFVNSTDWPGHQTKPHFSALYRNKGDGTFADVTAEAGLAIDVYGMGVCIGDYDNDGDADLFLTCIGPNHLYRNNGDGTFTDVTETAGVAGRPVEPGGVRWKWSSSAAWVDYDKDGLLDLFVENYVKWTPETDPFCGTNGVKAYCAPTNFEGVPSLLYHNEGNGRFRDVSDETGIARYVGKSFGVAVADFNDDGWPDWAVANDTKENFLFINREGKRFEERALEAGIAVSMEGVTRAGMGIDAADWRNDGKFGIIVGNFSRECLGLYQNTGDATFKDCTYAANVGETSLLSLTFGVFFFDYNLDGWQDIFAANGHIDDFIHTKDAKVTYEQLPLLYRGQPDGKFVEVGKQSGPALAQKRVLRGCAHGDFDNDGDQDIAVVWNNRSGELWRNDGGNANQWLGLMLQGTRSNRDGIGALVKVTANGVTQTAYRHSGGSFLSENDARMVFGLGGAKQADRVEVRWPSGTTSKFTDVPAGAYYLAVEGETQLKPWSASPKTQAQK